MRKFQEEIQIEFANYRNLSEVEHSVKEEIITR